MSFLAEIMLWRSPMALARACCKTRSGRFGSTTRENGCAVGVGQLVECVLEFAPSLDARLDRGFGGSRHIVAFVFSVAAKRHVRMRPVFGSAVVATTAWVAAGSKCLGGRTADDVLRELVDARDKAFALVTTCAFVVGFFFAWHGRSIPDCWRRRPSRHCV